MGGRIPSPTNAERLPDQIQGYSSKVVVMVGMVGSVVLVVLVVGYDGFDTIIACQVPGMEIKRKLRKPKCADFIFQLPQR